MILQILDIKRREVGVIQQYSDLKIVETEKEKTLSVKVIQAEAEIKNEYYIRTPTDEFVVKETPSQTNADPTIVAILNTEGLEQILFESFIKQDTSLEAAANEALLGTGWSLGDCQVEIKKRNVGMVQCNARNVLLNLATAFLCEIKFDSLTKKVSFYTKRGQDKGAYFMSGLNLRELSVKSTSYDYYTQVIPYGKDGLDITSVNNGKNYLENYQYTNKIRPYIWKDESYTDAQALKEDAEILLDNLSKPEKSYSAKIYDLSKNAVNKEEYADLSYEWGDLVMLVDDGLNVKDSQRIMKITTYPDEPEKDAVEIANAMLSFEEMQAKYKAAMEIVNFAINSSGQVNINSISVQDIIATEDFQYYTEDMMQYIDYAAAGAGAAVLDKIYWPGTEEINGSLLYEYSIASDKLAVGNGGNLYHTYDTFEQCTNESISYQVYRADVSIDTSQAFVGTQSCKVVPTAENARIYLGTEGNYGNIPVTPGNYYIASAYIRSDRAMHAGITVVQRDAGKTDVGVGETHYIETNTTWRRVQFPVLAQHKYLSICLAVQEASGTVWYDGLMVELIMSARQSASPFKVGGTTVVNGSNIITGAIMSRDYDGHYGNIDNKHGSVINLDGLGINFGGKLVYDQINDMLSIIAAIEALSFNVEKTDCRTYIDNMGVSVQDKKTNTQGGYIVFGNDYYASLHRNSLNFGIQSKPQTSHQGHLTYDMDEVFKFDKPIKFLIPSNGRQATPIGSWTNPTTGNAVASIGVDSAGNLMVYANFNGDGETYTTKYIKLSNSKG